MRLTSPQTDGISLFHQSQTQLIHVNAPLPPKKHEGQLPAVASYWLCQCLRYNYPLNYCNIMMLVQRLCLHPYYLYYYYYYYYSWA